MGDRVEDVVDGVRPDTGVLNGVPQARQQPAGRHARRPVVPSPDGPPPELRFKRRANLVRYVGDLWRARELVRTLAERDLRARYKQAMLGFAWAVITPLMLMLVFTVIYQRVSSHQELGIPDGVPYALFSYLGLLPWTFFMTSVTQGANALVSNTSLLNKVYCPREVFPIGVVMVAGVDMLIATGVLFVLFAVLTTAPAATFWMFPLFLLIQLAVTLGVVFFLSAVVVYFRDIRHMLPLLMQMGIFATPVAYGLNKIANDWLIPYVTLNPLAAVIDGYRRTILYGEMPDWQITGAAGASSLLILTGGYLVFKKLEPGIADVA